MDASPCGGNRRHPELQALYWGVITGAATPSGMVLPCVDAKLAWLYELGIKPIDSTALTCESEIPIHV
jgi:hypothetical protein